jgi:hypothetical protein
MNTKRKGNKAEAAVLSKFVKLEIPISLPFGDNEKYDLIAEIKNEFKSIQVKYGSYKDGVVSCDARCRIGSKRIEYETYEGKVDFIAIWCETLDQVYLIPARDKSITNITLRVEPPRNNSCISTIVWAKDYEI